MYFGSILIVKDSILYKSYKKLNIIFVDNFKNIKIKELDKNINNQAIPYKQFFKNYYETHINTDKVQGSPKINISIMYLLID